jgi:hypothetical protein
MIARKKPILELVIVASALIIAIATRPQIASATGNIDCDCSDPDCPGGGFTPCDGPGSHEALRKRLDQIQTDLQKNDVKSAQTHLDLAHKTLQTHVQKEQQAQSQK